MAHRLSTFPQPHLFRSPLVEHQPESIPSIDELEQLLTQLVGVQLRTLDRRQKAVKHVRDIEESIRRMIEKEKDQQYLEILSVLDALAAFDSMSDAIRTLRFITLGLVDVMTTSRADVLWQGDLSDGLVSVTAALNGLAWIFQKYQSASAALPGMVAEYMKNLTDFLNSRGEPVATQNHKPQERKETATATAATPRTLMPHIALAFLIEATFSDFIETQPDAKGVFVTDFNGRRIHVPLELCACWLDFCIFLEMFFRGEKESHFIASRNFGVHVPGEVDLLSGATWDSWISHSNQGGGAPCTSIDLYAIINDDSNGCPACKIPNPVQFPLPSVGNFQQCQSCRFTFLEFYQEVSGLEELGSNSMVPGSLTQSPLVSGYAPVQSDSVEYQSRFSYPPLPSETQSFTQASEIGTVSALASSSDGSGPAVPKHIQVVRRRKPFAYEEEQNHAVHTESITLPSHQTSASDTSQAPFDLVSFCHVLYIFLLFRLPDRYHRNAPAVLLDSQTSGRHRFNLTRGTTWETFHKNIKLDITYFGTAAGIAFSALFTTLQISSAANDPIVRTVVQLSIVCLFFGLLYSMVLWLTFEKLESEVEGITWMDAVINLTPRDTFWNLWIMLSMPLAWILWGFMYFAIFLVAFLWRSDATDEKYKLTPNQVYIPRAITTLVLVVGFVYFVLIIQMVKQFPSD